jgi:hypothetical protein
MQFRRIVTTKPKTTGTWQETAIIEIADENNVKSILNPENASANTVDDICYILSFLCGRIVCREGNEGFFRDQRSIDPPIISHNWIFYIRNYKPMVERIAGEGLGNAFFNTLYILQAHELLEYGYYASAVLNSIYSYWWRKNGRWIVKNTRSAIVDKANLILAKWLRRSTIAIIQKVLRVELPKEQQVDVIERLKANLGEPSALYQLTRFLEGIGLYEESQTASEKLKIFNQIRNRVVHSGDIYKNSKFREDLIVQINIAVIMITIDIIRYFFAHEMLQISDDTRVKNTREEILRYFNFGTYNGISVFQETYEDFRKRTAQDWISKGEV